MPQWVKLLSETNVDVDAFLSALIWEPDIEGCGEEMDKLGTPRRKGVARKEFQISDWIIRRMLVPGTKLRKAEGPHLEGKLLAFLALSFFTFVERGHCPGAA